MSTIALIIYPRSNYITFVVTELQLPESLEKLRVFIPLTQVQILHTNECIVPKVRS
jgi:hypothetical protein